MKLQPLSDRLIVEAVTENEVTKAGIILPETIDKEKPERGRVIAMGPGKMMDDGKRLAMDVKVGDMVIFKKYAPDEIKIDGKDYLILSESDIMAIVAE